MSELVRTQELFFRAIVHPTSVRDFLERADEETRVRFAETFSGSASFPAAERVEVYARGYFYRLLDVLAAQYPVVRAYLGGSDFHDLVTDFLVEHPSRSPNLHDLGNPFPEFVKGHACAATRPFLAGFAAIEEALARALDAADAHAISAALLARLDVASWPSFRLAPSATVVDAGWDMRDAQRSVREGRAPAGPEQGVATLVWRRGFTPSFRPIRPFEQATLAELRSGCSFLELCAVAEARGFGAEAVSSSLKSWLEDELLEGF